MRFRMITHDSVNDNEQSQPIVLQILYKLTYKLTANLMTHRFSCSAYCSNIFSTKNSTKTKQSNIKRKKRETLQTQDEAKFFSFRRDIQECGSNTKLKGSMFLATFYVQLCASKFDSKIIILTDKNRIENTHYFFTPLKIKENHNKSVFSNLLQR